MILFPQHYFAASVTGVTIKGRLWLEPERLAVLSVDELIVFRQQHEKNQRTESEWC